MSNATKSIKVTAHAIKLGTLDTSKKIDRGLLDTAREIAGHIPDLDPSGKITGKGREHVSGAIDMFTSESVAGHIIEIRTGGTVQRVDLGSRFDWNLYLETTQAIRAGIKGRSPWSVTCRGTSTIVVEY